MHTSYLGMDDDDAVAGRLEELNDHFSGMYRHFDDVSGTKHMERLRLAEDDIHRYHFINYISPGDNSSRPLDSLKDIIRESLKRDHSECVMYALDYAKDLERAFFAVRRIADTYKEDADGGLLSKVFMLERMGKIFPLLIGSWLRFGEAPVQMGRILKLVEGFIVRVYLTGGLRSDSGGSWLNRVAHGVHQGNLDYNGLVGELTNMNRHYQSDDQFRKTLTSEDLYNALSSRTIKYLLSEYEIHLRTRGDMALALSTQEELLTADYEVEHIWAQHPVDEISVDEELEHSQHVHRLGNLTIASESWNKSMGNKRFEEKRWQPGNKPSYSNSSLLVQKELAKLPTWDVGAINDRERDVLEFALQRWTV